jgi:hypothetical protein
MRQINCKRNTSSALTKYNHLFFKKAVKILFITSTVFTFKAAYKQDTGCKVSSPA